MPEANANPDKRFFLDLITRDISLEDAILDLIDNAIDSLVRIRNISLYKDFLNPEKAKQDNLSSWVKVNFSGKRFSIEDNCGGISFERAENEIFRFGHPDPQRGPSLSVFGIGMKRAIFKIGRQIEMESHAPESGFNMFLEVDKWLNISGIDWKIPLQESSGEKDPSRAGTKIIITKLKDEVATIVQNPTFQNKLLNLIQETYPFYLGRYISIIINGKQCEGEDISFGESDSIKPAIEVWEDGHVKATMICGLLPREDSKWTIEKSGWYILCNGRVIIYADRTKLTGWGAGLLPQFQPKNRGFLGTVFLSSDQPEDLPWNTTKRGINTESAVYIRALKRMVIATRNVIRVQDKMYQSTGEDEKEEYKESVKDLQTYSATKQAAERSVQGMVSFNQEFSFKSKSSWPVLKSIQFNVKVGDLERVKKCLGSARMSNREVGERIFKYFFDRECAQ